MSRDWKIAVAVSSFVAALAAAAWLILSPSQQRPLPPPRPVSVVRAATIPAPPPPPAEPSAEVPTLVEAATADIDHRVRALAGALSHMWTRNPEELVRVIDDASRKATVSPSVTLLLAIAHAETNGKILDVSEAGAVGLAQATPIACRQEQFDGKLYVTRDYLTGARAYITKKPLGDADTIASLIVAKDDPKTRRRARRLLDSAMELRLEGVDEVQRAKQHNLNVLRELDKLLRHGSRGQLRAFRDRVRTEYRDLKRVQVDSWRRYQLDLIARRDALLDTRFGDGDRVKRSRPYEAGEYLAEHLDERFSAKQMASFLVRHLERKHEEAQQLTDEGDDRVEEMTAALYNGGSHNVKRMLAGLIGSLPETEKYMKKVPATRRRLDASIADAGGSGAGARRVTAAR